MPERHVKLRTETQIALDKFHKLAKEEAVYRSRDVFRTPELAKATEEAIKALAEDLIRHSGAYKEISSVSFKILFRQSGTLAAPTENPVMSEIVTFCENCTCHYGYYDEEMQVCEYIGRAVEESCVDL